MITLKTQQTAFYQKNNNYKTAQLYNEATEDYEFWSPDFNMHFGYYSPFRTNPFKRDSMLNEMNRQIFNRINCNEKKELADLGCGMGATILYGLKHFKDLKITGVTLSDFQANEGNKMLKGLDGSIRIEDYNYTSFKDNALDGAIAIESFCHGGHSNDSFKEAYRIIRPGAKLIVADAFLKKEIKELCPGGSYCYKNLCEGWSLEKLGNILTIKKTLENIGFRKIIIEDISFRVAPSVLHVPFAISGFVLKKILNGEKLKPQTINNLKGSLFALLSGVQMNNFGYYIITCTK